MKYKPFATLWASLVCLTLLLSSSPLPAEIIGNSAAEFSGTQGQNNWFFGYRNRTADGGGVDYDHLTQFIQFAGGDGLGSWNGTSQLWTGSAWDVNTAPAAPWTFMSVTNLHPNGTNSGAEHWVIRRWFGDELSSLTPLAVTWHTRKQSAGGNGVTGALYLNGVRVDHATVAGTNTDGVTRTFYLHADFGQFIDLALTPLGTDGTGADGSDGAYNWMTIDTTIPEIPRQPDGTIFIPNGSPDSDGDGLPDVWEYAYSPGDLTRFNATSDYDGDGLNDSGEYAKSTDPTDADTDNDGLSDGVETGTGTFVSATDTGTQPRNPDTDGDGRTDGAEVNGPPTTNPTLADTDGDGFSDGSELSTGHNPNDAAHNPNTTLIANSLTEFSGVQGANDWYAGYRNVSVDGAGVTSYNHTNDFIQFAGGAGLGDWNGTSQLWQGSQWDVNTAPAAPWTELGPENVHPNGASPVHWVIRRWVANEITNVTPLALRWHTRKSSLAGSGVTGGVFVNGQRGDTLAIAGNNGTGVTRTYYANIRPGDVVDLILSPRGTDNSDADGSDGSRNWLRVDTAMPPNPVQPDGTPFVPATGSDSDADGLLDAWEQLYFPGNLAALSGAGDYDADGLSDLGEFQRDSNPTLADTDGDGLSDLVESNTGNFVSPTNTGTNPKLADTDNDGLNDYAEVFGSPATNPTRADSDGDGFTDPAELAEGTNPNDPADNPLTFVIANSIAEFSGVQGANGWYNGYRNYSTDGGAANYDPNANFIAYAGGAGFGAWDGVTQLWTGDAWDVNTAAAGPWTFQNAQGIHPNGVNSAPNQEHWAIRRWAAAEIASVTPAVVIWRVIKENLNASGVTGSLHVNGTQVDSKTIGGADGTNPVRRFYLNLNPGDLVDLALTPEGLGGDRSDGADGSITWFWVDTRLPREPRQPDGTLFIPANAPDSDGDGLPDFWELIYAADLTVFTGTGDNDGDGLNNLGELERDANPLLADTDGDGLSDLVETKTGTFVSATDTGSNPRKADTDGDGRSDHTEVNVSPTTNPNLADTDGDGYNDGSEVATGHNPNDSTNNPLTTSLANSRTEFSGVQGQGDWRYGYRNLDADGGGSTYDPVAHFVQFGPETWNGAIWDLALNTSPWTEIGLDSSHPSGPAPLHWSVRRWTATELTGETPVALRWHVRRNNASCGNGVTGGIYINGQPADRAVIAFDNLAGVTRTYYAVLQPGDVVDLIHSPTGTDNDNNDGCDSSSLWLEIDTAIPPNPRQPDGTPFTGHFPRLMDIDYTGAQVTLVWKSQPGRTYRVEVTEDFNTWTSVATGHVSGGAQTSFTETFAGTPPAQGFYRVVQE